MKVIYEGCHPQDYVVSVSREPKVGVEVHIHVPENAKSMDNYIFEISEHYGLTDDEKNEVFMFVRQQIIDEVITLPLVVDIS